MSQVFVVIIENSADGWCYPVGVFADKRQADFICDLIEKSAQRKDPHRWHGAYVYTCPLSKPKPENSQ